MNGSYTQYSANTEEFQEGKDAALVNTSHEPIGDTMTNPYESGTKQWLDWQIGYDVLFQEEQTYKELMEIIQKSLNIARSTFAKRF